MKTDETPGKKKLILKKEEIRQQEPDDLDDVFEIIGHDESLQISPESQKSIVSTTKERTAVKAMENFIEELEGKKKKKKKKLGMY